MFVRSLVRCVFSPQTYHTALHAALSTPDRGHVQWGGFDQLHLPSARHAADAGRGGAGAGRHHRAVPAAAKLLVLLARCLAGLAGEARSDLHEARRLAPPQLRLSRQLGAGRRGEVRREGWRGKARAAGMLERRRSPLAHGCSLWHMWLQLPAHTAAASGTYDCRCGEASSTRALRDGSRICRRAAVSKTGPTCLARAAQAADGAEAGRRAA